MTQGHAGSSTFKYNILFAAFEMGSAVVVFFLLLAVIAPTHSDLVKAPALATGGTIALRY